jgi:hypothetical protein
MHFEALPDEIRIWSRDNFTGNECGSDEYRETQPAKGFGMITELFEIYEGGAHDDEARDTLRLVESWLHHMNNPQPEDYSYAGADELVPILERYHDRLWDTMGKHPYDYSAEEVLNQYMEDHDN